jgi:hypothetical protein
LEPKIQCIKPLPEYRLQLGYETGEVKVFDVKPYIRVSWYNELRNQAYFSAVRIVDDGYGIEWPNGQDLAPHELYELGVLA